MPASSPEDLEQRLRELEARASRLALDNQALAERTRALTESERHLRLFQILASRSRDAILFIRADDGRILEANEGASGLYGYPRAVLQAMTMADLRAPEDLPRLQEQLRLASQSGARFEARHRRRDGSMVDVEISAQPADVDGARAVVSVIRDISQRKATETALLQSEARFRAAFATSPDAINLNRLEDGIYVAINQGFTRLTGWTEADVLGRSSLDLDIWVDRAERERLVAGLRASGRVENLEASFRFKDGRIRIGLMSAQVLSLDGVPHILSVSRDITAIRQAEVERNALADQLRQSQKLEAIGRLAGGVAHDFNNLLTVVLSTTAVLKEDLAAGRAPTMRELDEIEAAGQRARDLTRQLLGFARKQVVDPVPLDLNRVLRSSETLLRRALGDGVILDVRPAPGLGLTMADAGQIDQVLLNLAINARDAMPGGGRLILETNNAGENRGDAVQDPLGETGSWVRLAVRDTGSGMSPDVRAHIFEPFYTTKESGKGTGLGLAVVHGIVSQAGGHIHVESVQGQGSTFVICLPRVEREASAPASPAWLPSERR